MNLLLDTHIFIWLQIAVRNVSAPKLQILKDPRNILYLSLASIWEIQIKTQIGKFKFPKPLPDIISEQQVVNNLQILPTNIAHIYELENLPFHHKDPFDRLLIAQAKIENLTIVTDDAQFAAYGANIL